MSFDAVAYAIVVTVNMVAAGALVFFYDKILYRLGLSCIVLACAAVFWEMWSSGETFSVLRTSLLFSFGTCLFLVALALHHASWFERKAKEIPHPWRRETDKPLPMRGD